jgi:hypothetical protein
MSAGLSNFYVGLRVAMRKKVRSFGCYATSTGACQFWLFYYSQPMGLFIDEPIDIAKTRSGIEAAVRINGWKAIGRYDHRLAGFITDVDREQWVHMSKDARVEIFNSERQTEVIEALRGAGHVCGFKAEIPDVRKEEVRRPGRRGPGRIHPAA